MCRHVLLELFRCYAKIGNILRSNGGRGSNCLQSILCMLAQILKDKENIYLFLISFYKYFSYHHGMKLDKFHTIL